MRGEPVSNYVVERLMRSLLLAACLSFGCTGSASTTPSPRPERPVSQGESPVSTVTGAWQSLGRFGDANHRECVVRAWVPEHAEGARLPMLIVLDGSGVSEWFQVDSTVAALASEHRIEPWIILAIESASDRDQVLARVDGQLAHFITREILPAAREALPWREERASTAILGYSYGGLSAVASAIAAPDVFGRVVAMSPSLWVQERAIMPRFEDARVLPSRLWIDVGSAEPDEGDLIPYMVSDARNLRDLALHRRMIFGRDVGYLEAIGEGHDMRAGGRRMREALLFALSEIDFRTEAASTLHVTRYPAPRAPNARNSTFAIEVGYVTGARLTWPESLLEVHAGQTRLRRDIAPLRSRLRVDAFGLHAETE
jgi:enterochelin esterase-like enzyme